MNDILGNGVLLAPLAGVADAAFRILTRHFGAGPLMSEMVSAHGLDSGRHRLLEVEFIALQEQRPLAIQFVGSDPAAMVRASLAAAGRGADSINLNMACPARKIVGSGKGCALMRDIGRAREILAAVAGACTVPVTVKIRAGWDPETINAVDFSMMAQDAGAAAIYLHPRTRAQGFSGQSDWSLIRAVKQAVTIPLVGNGDIRTADDALRMIDQTGCDGVMIGRGAMGRPWLFSEILCALGKPQNFPAGRDSVAPLLPEFDLRALELGSAAEIGKVIRAHADLSFRFYGEAVAARELRKNLCWYTRGLPGSASFRAGVHRVVDRASLLELVEEYLGQCGR